MKAGEGKIAHTNSNTFGVDESADVARMKTHRLIQRMRKKKEIYRQD
jgi:hypothetical protein